MSKEEYVLYLKSEDWKERRKILLEQADYKCSKCDNKANQLHHLNYRNLGMEVLDDDVIAICSDCHKDIHGKKNEYKPYSGY
jgi:5-methylcytosine-specific restriction endonuclease McrA